MIDNVDLGRDLAPYRQPSMVFTTEEGLLVDGITAAEVLAAQVIKVPSEVMYSFIQVQFVPQFCICVLSFRIK
jgi:hypothetical protein